MQENNRSLDLDMDLDLDPELDMFLDQSAEFINQPFDNIWLSSATCFLTMTVNIWSMKVLKTKEDHCIIEIVIFDCVSNILISVEALLFNLNVGFPLNTSVICALRHATFISLSTFTRLVPVAIVLLRYIMVCHPALFIDWGREKGIWKWILRSVVVLCLTVWFYSMYTSSITYRFLRCVGREEDFG